MLSLSKKNYVKDTSLNLQPENLILIQNATHKEQIENEGSSPPGLVIMTYELESFSTKSIFQLESRRYH